MAKFRLTNKAQADLRRIGRDTQQNWGREQRNIYLGKLDSSFHQLADNPRIGRECSEVKQAYRFYHCERHLIFYRLLEADSVEIVRILHDRMDYLRHFVADDA